MKWFAFLLVSLLFCSGCDLRYREQELQMRQAALDQKEKELMLKETALELKEAELLRREYSLDSTRLSDTAYEYNTDIVGAWSVKMTCTETTCPSSAVGDTKSEVWEFTYQDNVLIAKARSGSQLVRVYTGKLAGTALELTEAVASSPAGPGATIVVRLNMINAQSMEGERQIVRENCRIIYALQLSKQ